MQVKIQVGESDAPKVKIGMKTLLRLDAAPAKVYHGVVKDISSLATEASPWDSGSMPGRKNFEVTVAVKETDRKVIKPGMSADVEFICDQVSKAMYIPLESVVEKDGKTFVYVKKGKKFVPVQVKLGKQNDNFACVLKNLHKGDVVALRDPTRPLDEQEAGKNDSDNSSDDKNNKSTAPMPVSQKKK
jgi:multidrug efflux pump subunit AcrA (membrane-fusion protein)